MNWSDEFNSGTLDTSKWNIETGTHGFGGNELQAYTNRPENVRVENGNLVLTARRESYNGMQYTSGRVNTKEKFAYRTGTLEIRAKLSHVAIGLGPALWTVGGFGSAWPLCGEIDIMELFSDLMLKNTLIAASLSNTSEMVSFTSAYNVADATAWHTYRLDRTLDRIKFYIDGVLARNTGKDTFAQWKYDLFDHFILLNLAVGGNRPWGNPNASTPFPATMLVDYVRYTDNITSVPVPEPIPTPEPVPQPTPVPGGLMIVASNTTSRASNWNVDGTELYAWSPAWAEYSVTGPATSISVTCKQRPNPSYPNLAVGYAFKFDVSVDGVFKGTINVPGNTVAQTGSLNVNIPTGTHSVKVAWTNDSWNQSAGIDANCQLVSINVATTTPAPEPTPVPAPSDPKVTAKAKLTSAVWTPLTVEEADALINL